MSTREADFSAEDKRDRRFTLRLRSPMQAFFIVVWLVLPLIFSSNNTIENVLTLSMVWAFWALSLNIVWGFAGQFSMTQVALGGVSAYACIVLTSKEGWPLILAVPVSIVAAVLFSVLIALICLRLEGFGFAIMTLAFSLAFVGLVASLSLTGSNAGLEVSAHWAVLNIGPITWDLAGQSGGFAFFANIIFFALVGLLWLFLRTKYGRAFLAIREDHVLANSLGISPPVFRVVAFALGGIAAGVAGLFQAQYYAYIYPDLFSFTTLVNVIVVVVLGGPGRLFGPLIGGIVFAALSVGLPIGGNIQQAIFGVAIILITMFAREGLAYYLGRGQSALWTSIMKRIWPRSIPRSARSDASPASTPEPDSASAAEVAKKSVKLDSVSNTVPHDRTLGPVILEGRDIRKSFGGVNAVRDLSFEVHEGEIFGLIGPNGAGKTTAFNLITGFTRPDGGAVLWKGTNVTRSSPSARARNGLVRTFQQPRNFPRLTVRENMVIAAQSHKGQRREVDRVLEEFELTSQADLKAGELSYGYSKRLGVAMAAASGAEMLMLDEPAAGLNAADILQLGVDLRRLRDTGCTIWLVEHHIDLITALCDRVLVLDAGVMITTGTPETVTNDPRVIEAYLGAPR